MSAVPPLSGRALIGLTLFALLAFAANSILCRLALRLTSLDAASFTSLRLISGALVLCAIVRWRQEPLVQGGHWAGSWWSALALFGYAAAFSFAYIALAAGTGALILFGAVQATMILTGLWRGERLRPLQSLGLLLAVGGLVALMLPGVTAPSLGASLLMLLAGICWGIYSLRGRGVPHPTLATAGNFLRAVPMTLALSALSAIAFLPWQWDSEGAMYALLSGAVASALGYSVWYMALRGLNATQAASVQLCVPVIATLGGVLLLDEALTWRLVLSSLTILGGIGMIVWRRRPA